MKTLTMPTRSHTMRAQIIKAKILCLSALITLGLPAQANSKFEQAETFREALRLAYVNGEAGKAAILARQLQQQVAEEDPLSQQIQALLTQIDKAGGDQKLLSAIGFLTGEKWETYCKNVGLVQMRGEHRNGTKSSVLLISSNRKLSKDSYSQMLSGSWFYELENKYRKPIRSEVFVTGSESSYNVSETRRLPSGSTDRGTFKSNWNKSDRTASYSTTGNVVEPAPMFLATDYHLWGNWDLGFQIQFELGKKSQSGGRESSGSKEIRLASERTVSEHLPSVQYVDAQGGSHAFNDCYVVHYKIKVKEVGPLEKN